MQHHVRVLLVGGEQMGEMLGALLFPSTTRSFLDRSRDRLKDNEGLRIRLRLDTYALADLPWEYAYVVRPDTPLDQKGPDGFLVLDRRISLVRYEVMGQALVSLDPVGTGPLKLVALLANPTDPLYRSLDLHTEQRNIEQALGGLSAIKLEAHPAATVQILMDALVGGAHVFHFAGHGVFEGDLGTTFDSQTGKGSLVLLDDNGRAKLLSAEKLALTLRGRGVRLAVLGACEAGRRDQINAWTGVVPALTRAGIPAVVGMQYTILDRNAIAFSRQFYRALAAGQSIDAAVTDGRQAIFATSNDDDRDWGVPVLYLRATEGVLFPHDAEESTHALQVGGNAGKGASVSDTLPGSVRRPAAARNAAPIDKVALRTTMVQAFNVEDLEVLCADVEQALKNDGIQEHVNLDMVGGSGKPIKVLNLIQYLDHRGLLSYLVAAIRQARPGLVQRVNSRQHKIAHFGFSIVNCCDQHVTHHCSPERSMELNLDLINVQRLLVKHFDLDGLRGLCFDLRVDYDDLAGETKSAKARELVKHCYRTGLLDDLYHTGKHLRPQADWQTVIEHGDADALPDQWAEPLQRLYALVRAFNRNRHQPFSDRRTTDGDEIAFQMREAAPFVFDQFDVHAWLTSSSVGKRLAAIKYLDWLQDVEFLDDLLKRLISESAFIQLHLLLAIYSMVDQVEEKKVSLMKAAMLAYKINYPDASREFWRKKILEAL